MGLNRILGKREREIWLDLFQLEKCSYSCCSYCFVLDDDILVKCMTKDRMRSTEGTRARELKGQKTTVIQNSEL